MMTEIAAIAEDRAPRAPVLFTAAVVADSTEITVRLRNISQSGALIEADALPAAGSKVEMRRHSICVGGTLVWVNGRLAGIKFDRLLLPSEILGARGPAHVTGAPPPGSLIPRPSADFRRPALRQQGLSQVERTWIERFRH